MNNKSIIFYDKDEFLKHDFSESKIIKCIINSIVSREDTKNSNYITKTIIKNTDIYNMKLKICIKLKNNLCIVYKNKYY